MISIEFYKGLPIEYESFLIEKYESFIANCHYIEIYYPGYEINYMLIHTDGVLMELLVFGNKGNTSICFNSLAHLDQKIVVESSKAIFEKFLAIQRIKIDASYKSYELNKSVLFFTSDDHILDLPTTMDEYYSKLGRSTRQHIKNHKVKLLRDYPSAQFTTKFGAEIDEAIVDKIIQLNIDRMKYKGAIPGINNLYKNNILKFSQHYGCVAYIEVDGEIVAGNISSIIKKGIFGHLTAYDNNFYKYSIGEICAFYIIETAIEKGLSTFHFLWGESDLKKRLLGKQHSLFSYYIYRSYSFGFILSTIKSISTRTLTKIKLSEYSKPLRNVIKNIRKKRVQQQTA